MEYSYIKHKHIHTYKHIHIYIYIHIHTKVEKVQIVEVRSQALRDASRVGVPWSENKIKIVTSLLSTAHGHISFWFWVY